MFTGSDEEELRAIDEDHQHTHNRTVEKVLNLTLNNNHHSDETVKERAVQHHGSFEMLTRVFPFHPKSAIENAMETCAGDIAKAVQQLVGHSPSLGPAEEAASSAKICHSLMTSPSAKLNYFQNTVTAATSGTSTFPVPSTSPNRTPLYSQITTTSPSMVPTSSSSTSINLLGYPSSLRMTYPSAGMMSFLHPSAYFAAAAAAAAAASGNNPHSYPWLFPSAGHYTGASRSVVQQPQQHLCLPGCSVCPVPIETPSTSSSSSSSSPGDLSGIQASTLHMMSTDDVFKSNGRKDVFHHHHNSQKF